VLLLLAQNLLLALVVMELVLRQNLLLQVLLLLLLLLNLIANRAELVLFGGKDVLDLLDALLELGRAFLAKALRDCRWQPADSGLDLGAGHLHEIDQLRLVAVHDMVNLVVESWITAVSRIHAIFFRPGVLTSASRQNIVDSFPSLVLGLPNILHASRSDFTSRNGLKVLLAPGMNMPIFVLSQL
jgi:hypothetical protein